MQATLPWPVSPEFQDALLLATQRHLATSPEQPSTPSPTCVPRSASLMMKTRVAVRDKTPHRFQVVPLREAPKNHDKASLPTWGSTVSVVRGVGLGLNVIPPPPPPTVERGRERTPRETDVAKTDTPKRKGILRSLQGLSPSRARSSPDRKENRQPGTPTTTRAHRLREYTVPETTSTPIPSHNMPEDHTIGPDTVVIQPTSFEPTSLPENQTITASSKPTKNGKRALPRHGKSPSLGAIHHLLSESTASQSLDEKPRVRCRKRTNTLSVAHASTKRYGVYTPGKLDFSPVVPQLPIMRPMSTYSLGALLSAYSCDSLSSVYSQESFVEFGTRPLRVQVRSLQGHASCGQTHPIVLQLLHDVDTAIGDWLF
ncbi:hypothetical protein C8F01DRAFT_1375958 [Mycena amicta]|nr:hypothetical protein C8F01DRAFT_1375958 [Mycena amicta]